MKKLIAIMKDENGQGMVEYGLILGLIAVAAIAILLTIGGKVTNIFKGADSALGSVPGSAPAGN